MSACCRCWRGNCTKCLCVQKDWYCWNCSSGIRGNCTNTPPPTITVLSWNIQGCGGKGLSEARNTLVPNVVETLYPDVLLLQETYPRCLVEDVKSLYDYESVMDGKENESQILYDPTLYHNISDKKIFPNLLSHLSVNDALVQSITAIIPPARVNEDGGMRRDFRGRLSCVGLIIKGYPLIPQNVTIFMSYHNFRRCAVVRNKAAVYLCEIVDNMQRLTGARVVVGADLNLNIMEYQNPDLNFTLEQKEVIEGIMPTVLPYETTVWRMDKKMIDFIFFNGPNDQIVEEVEALDFVIAKFDEDDCLHEIMKHILPKDKKEAKREIKKFRKAVNHDPLVFKIMT